METAVSNNSDEEELIIDMEPKNVPITLELGDIIEIIAPTNQDISGIYAYIRYIDNKKVTVVNVENGTVYQLTITDEGYFTDESITQINILSRSDEKGYARQNGLLTGTWIDIHFGGDIPAIITGEITNLDEDMIEVTTTNEKTIFINFGYKGIPENIPIESIVIRNKPTQPRPSTDVNEEELLEETDSEEETSGPSLQFTDTGESIISIPEDSTIDPTIHQTLQELYIEADNIVFGERLEPLKRLVEVPYNERRYGIEAQLNDLNDELLSTIPNSQRTIKVLSNIQTMIERFKELREQFSQFDTHNDVYGVKTNGINYKPLVERIYKMDTLLKWIIPVVSHRKKIYGEFSDEIAREDVVYNTSGRELRAIEALQNRYYDRKNVDTSLTYSAINKQIQSIMMPFEYVDNQDNFLSHTDVLTNIDAVIDNLGKFKSSVFDKDNEVETGNFVIQRYNLGLSHIKKDQLKSGKTLYIRNEMTPNDKMTVKSLLFLPESVVKFSAIHLPSTNIMDRTNLHHNYLLLFKLLRKNADIVPYIIEDLSKELDYEQMEKDNALGVLNRIQSFALDPNMSIERFEGDEKLKQLLDVIVPKTRFLIRFVRKHIKDKISFLDIVKKLEPYMIYSSDLKYGHYNEIRYFMKERITEIKKQLISRAKDFELLRSNKYSIFQYPNTVLKVLNEKTNVSADTFFESYSFLQDKFNTKLTAQEIILRMNHLDNSNLYTNLITSVLISLITPKNFTDALSNQSLDDITDNEQIKPTDCTRRFLTKKYTSMSQLQKDNNTDEVYYDKEFDDTPYDILKKYKDEQKKKSPADFHEFLTENLIQIHSVNKELAPEIATTLIAGKKLVRDGEFALLEQRPTLSDDVDEDKLSEREKQSIDIESDARKRISYYRRVNTNWIQDISIDTEAFIDTNTLFCNISRECYKNLTNKTCETNNNASSRFNDYNRQKLLGEFDKRFSVSVEELGDKLTENILLHQQHLIRLKILSDIKLKKANNLAFTVGTLAHHNENMQSPHIPTRNVIMSETNFPTKQSMICQFVANYCRQSMVNELQDDKNWLYCKDTNTKLFPLSIYTLADTYINNPHHYINKLDELCRTVGVLSDDGDDIVDKYSGMVLRKREFMETDEYDEAGFRITSHDIIEKDLGTVVMENLGKKEERVFESETSKIIYNVFSTICSNIDINIDPLSDFILQVANDVIDKSIMSEKVYKKKSDKAEKEKGKPLPPYDSYRNETMIFIIASVLLIAIQTAIPSFQTKRTFPSCVRSFSGFPMDGIEDTTGIQYIACVLNKLKSDISLWKSIKNYKSDLIAKRIQEITTRIINRIDISEMYTKKREYNLLHPEIVSPQEHHITKWIHFLPPLIEFTVAKNLHPVSSEFKSDFIELLKRGHNDQHGSIAVLKSKILQYGCGIIESINNVVKKKDLLLKSSTRLFLENACCNETDVSNPITYFNVEDDSIHANITIVNSLGLMLHHLKTLSRPPILYHSGSTRIKHAIVSSGNEEEKIYSAVIHYCNFDKDLPVPEIYNSICSQRPDGYDRKWSLSDKIEFLKKNGKRYTIEDLTKLMTIVNGKNTIHIDNPASFSQIDVLKQIIHRMNDADDKVIDARLREHLMNVLKEYKPNAVSSTKTSGQENLTRYLKTANSRLLTQLSDFLNKYGNLTQPKQTKIYSLLSNIQKWNIDSSMAETGNYYEEGFPSALQFIHNAIYHISKVYPAALLYKSSFFKTVPTHWGIHHLHANDLQKFIDKYYENLKPFQEDVTLLKLLQDVTTRLTNMDVFLKHIPVHTNVVKEVDGTIVSFHSVLDKNTVYLLYTYCYYSALYEYIICSNDSSLEQIDIQERKNTSREQRANQRNSSNQLHSIETNINEIMIDQSNDLQEVQIIAGNRLELKHRVGELLNALLEIEVDNKDAVDMSYEQIIRKVNRSKDKEKSRILAYFHDMTQTERNIEFAMKENKIGRWNVGQQKGLFQYDPKTYERERSEMIAELYDEKSDMADVPVDALDIFELDKLDAVAAAVDDEGYTRDTYDFQELDEDYDDGDYYQEDDNDF